MTYIVKRVLAFGIFLAMFFTGAVMPAGLANGTQLHASGSNQQPADQASAQTQGDFESMTTFELTAAMQPGWNLGNTLDAIGGETNWGNPAVTADLIRAIREQGFNSIRIPITWDGYIGDGPGFVIEADFMSRVHEVVDWALDAGFIVLMNMHHDSHWLHEMPSRGDDLIQRYRAVWEQIAESFKDYPGELFFEPINEPRFSDDWGLETAEFFDIVDRLNHTAYEVIRGSGGLNSERPVVFETLVAGITKAKVDSLKQSILSHDDPNIIASVHYYGLWHFSMNLAGKVEFDAEVRADIDQQMQLLHDTFVADGIAVILGEYGLLGFDDHVGVIRQGEKLKFFDHLVHTAAELGVVTMLWDNGQHFDRDELRWRDPSLHATILQAVGGRSGQAEHDAVYIRQSNMEDVEVELILSDNELTGIVDSSAEVWAPGSDYELEGNVLTLRADAILKLTGGEIGRDHSLSLQFSEGPDWLLTVAMIDEATLSPVTARSYGFNLPVQLNGDEVKRVQAVSRSGASISEQGWTAYLSYSSEYTVDYEEGLIQINAVPLTRFGQGDIFITVETWSGLELPYVLTITEDAKHGVPGTEAVDPDEVSGTEQSDNPSGTGEGTAASTTLPENPATETGDSAPSPDENGADDAAGDNIVVRRSLIAGAAAVLAAAGIGAIAWIKKRKK